MQKLFVVAALAALAIPALAAGDRCLTSSYRCENACPLAQKANFHRSFGTEAFVASQVARADLAGVVLENLARI